LQYSKNIFHHYFSYMRKWMLFWDFHSSNQIVFTASIDPQDGETIFCASNISWTKKKCVCKWTPNNWWTNVSIQS
jgi:hypothetical protein